MGAILTTLCGSSCGPDRPVCVRPASKKEKAPKSIVVEEPDAKNNKHMGRLMSKSSSFASIDRVDEDANLWHGRERASFQVHRHSMNVESAGGGTMGILEGVIFPCMANILGVLLFLRLPWIVGKAGILNGFFLVFVCCCCTFLTTLSLSAVATNGKILGGGSYFLISRSLGPALGAGVGLCFYMANSIGAAMYFMGTVEAWEIAMPNAQILTAGDMNNIRVTGFCILAVALVIVAAGIKYVAKLGTVFLFIVLAVIGCMYLGCLIGPLGSNTYELELKDAGGSVFSQTFTWSGPSSAYFAENFAPAFDAEQKAFPLDTGSYDFISLMALWFPAVTGIMAGSNRSADLKDPAGYIPKGTLFAQVFTTVIYLSFVVLYGCCAPRVTLLDDKFFASSSSFPVKEIVLYGVMASTIGAGLTSLVSGTRLLSAIAADGTLPILKRFAATPGREPRLALVASGVLCACAVAIGELNAVAPILTMFFLMCYTCVNMSCAVLHAVSDPNWRPGFRYHHWAISLLGAILCVWMMFAINPLMAMVAILFCSGIFAYAAYNSHEVKWGDGFQGMKFQLARNILTRMDLKTHTKNWRPQLLVITHASIRREEAAQGGEGVLDLHDTNLLKFVSQLKGGRGITIVGGVCSTKGVDVFSEGGMFFGQQERQSLFDGQDDMQEILRKYGIEGFGRLVYTRDPAEGFMSLMQIAGLGAFQPNCVLAAWPRKWKGSDKSSVTARSHFLTKVQTAVVFQKVMIVAKGDSYPDFDEKLTGNIDIWWIVGDGGILLLLPFLLAKHHVWSRCITRLWVLADKLADDTEMMKTELDTYVRDFRLNIEVHVKVIDNEGLDDDGVFPDGLGKEGSGNVPSTGFQREMSGTSSLGEGISKWRQERNMSGTGFERQTSSGSTWPQRTLNGKDQLQRQVSSESRSFLTRQTSTGSRAFPANPPGTIGYQSRVFQGADEDGPRPVAPPAGAGLNNTSFGKSTDASDDFLRQFSSMSAIKQGMFMTSSDQLTSTKPLSGEQLELARGLNRHLASESKDADLVVTNLPDMPPGESAYGYFQLVEAMSKDLKRCVLVRSTATEVITAFT